MSPIKKPPYGGLCWKFDVIAESAETACEQSRGRYVITEFEYALLKTLAVIITVVTMYFFGVWGIVVLALPVVLWDAYDYLTKGRCYPAIRDTVIRSSKPRR